MRRKLRSLNKLLSEMEWTCRLMGRSTSKGEEMTSKTVLCQARKKDKRGGGEGEFRKVVMTVMNLAKRQNIGLEERPEPVQTPR
jgi:hypothetical protein